MVQVHVTVLLLSSFSGSNKLQEDMLAFLADMVRAFSRIACHRLTDG